MVRTMTFIYTFIMLLGSAAVAHSQGNCDYVINEQQVLQDENLDKFLDKLQSQHFQTYRNKDHIPAVVRKQLSCLAGEEGFTIANPGKPWNCCCTSDPKLPRRQLYCCAQSSDVLMLVYIKSHGPAASNIILLVQLQPNGAIADLWTAYGTDDLTSKEQVIKYIRDNRGDKVMLHGNYIEL